MAEPLGLDRFTIYVDAGPIQDDNGDEATAACEASPEYRMALISIDPTRVRTGDDLGEIAAHELAHIPTWPIFAVAEENANLAAEAAPEYMREGLRDKLLEEVRKAGEDCTTAVGHTFIRLLRRLWSAEKRIETLQRELKDANKRLKARSGDA